MYSTQLFGHNTRPQINCELALKDHSLVYFPPLGNKWGNLPPLVLLHIIPNSLHSPGPLAMRLGGGRAGSA